MISDLTAVVQALDGEDEEENWLRIVNPCWSGEHLHLDTVLRTENGVETGWRLHCHGRRRVEALCVGESFVVAASFEAARHADP